MIPELVLARRHVLPLLLEADDRIRGGGELFGLRSGEAAHQDGQNLLAIHHAPVVAMAVPARHGKNRAKNGEKRRAGGRRRR
jgi:hypothetical protein